jgi:hypothetical protein
MDEFLVSFPDSMSASRYFEMIGPETPHRFTAIGDEMLVAVAIHASDRFIIENLGD